MLIAYFWLGRVPVTTIVEFTGHSSRTITSYVKNLRELTSCLSENVSQKIGGPGIVVEIDESKFGKRKYNRGHRVEGVWVVGGVELTPERRVFLLPVEDRSRETLHSIIEEYVEPGSVIHTDLWRGYQGINETIEVEHRTVNHSEHFKDPESGVHTNTIEGTWNGIKHNIKPRNRNAEQIDDHLLEFIWRRINEKDRWQGLLKQLKEVAIE